MKASAFKSLLKNEKSSVILNKYMLNEIYLTDRQLEQVCELGEHHGGMGFKYNKRKEVKNDKRRNCKSSNWDNINI